MPSPTEITPAQLLRLIGTPDCPTLLDVRTDDDFADDPRLIPSAIRVPFERADDFTPENPDGKFVVYCQKGLKISQGFAALLRLRGLKAETLMDGQFGWRDKGLPFVDAAKLPAPDPSAATVWVTRHRPKIDRIACPWLIRRFVDPRAKFLFVAPSQVLNVAERFGATPFDVEDVFWSHRGEKCTFDTMLAEFGLAIPALDRLALIIRGADTARLDLAPEAAGLLAASLGLSRMYKDDLLQLDAGLMLYDSFFRWARDAVEEGHDWPQPQSVKKKTVQ